MAERIHHEEWVGFDHLTHTVTTQDGTRVAAEVCESAQSLLDVLYVAHIRAEQRATETTQ